MTGWTAARALAVSWSVSSWLNEELATTSGPIELGGERPFRLVEATGHEPGQPGPGLRRPRCRAARARSSASRTRPTSVRTTRPAPGVQREQGRLRGIGQAGDGHLEQARALVGGEVRGERGVDPGDPLLERDLLLVGERDGLLGREVVLGRRRSRGGLARRRPVWLSLGKSSARGATMSRGARSPTATVERRLRQDVRRPGSRSGRRRGSPAAIASRTASLRVNRAIASARWVSMGRSSDGQAA